LRPVGADNGVTSRDLQVLVDEAAEPVPSEDADVRSRTRRDCACGRSLIQGSVRPVGVEVLEVLAQHDSEVTWPGDQEVVEALAAQRADEAFGDRVCPRRPDGGADDADVGAGCGSTGGRIMSDQRSLLVSTQTDFWHPTAQSIVFLGSFLGSSKVECVENYLQVLPRDLRSKEGREGLIS
jgi:hypothetical protein